MSAAKEPIVSVRGLRFAYPGGGFSLEIPELSIGERGRVVLIGPSGSGKSTFLGLISGILAPLSGELRVAGIDVARASDRARRRFRIQNVGFVFQEFELLEHLTVRENILLPYFVNRAIRLDAAAAARAADLARRAGIEPLLSRRPRALSHGERQRVAICRALVANPRLILADEPTGNLDPRTTRTILDLLLEEAARVGATLLMVTHDHGLLGAFERVIDFEDVAFRRDRVSEPAG